MCFTCYFFAKDFSRSQLSVKTYQSSLSLSLSLYLPLPVVDGFGSLKLESLPLFRIRQSRKKNIFSERERRGEKENRIWSQFRGRSPIPRLLASSSPLPPSLPPSFSRKVRAPERALTTHSRSVSKSEGNNATAPSLSPSSSVSRRRGASELRTCCARSK